MQNNNDFIVISKNILKRRMILLFGMIFMAIIHTLFFVISYIIRGNEIAYLIIDGLICFSLWVYLIFYIAKGKNKMFESLYRMGRLIYCLPILYYAVIATIHGITYHAINYEYIIYMVLSIALELFIFRFNLKDPNPLKRNNKSLAFSIVAIALIPAFLVIGHYTNAEISVLDFSRNAKYELNDSGTLTLTGVYDGLSKDVKIPESFYTQKVTEIGDGAFYNSNLDSIYISASIEKIGAKAFYNIKDVYLEGNPYLEEESLYGVSVLHILDKENVLEVSDDFFNGDHIDVDREIIDKYRQNESFDKYSIEPKLNSDEVFIHFDKSYGYIDTVILKKGEALSTEVLKNTSDSSYWLYNLTKDYLPTNAYYKTRYNIDKKVIPYWLTEENDRFYFGDKVEKSMILSPKVEDVLSCKINYNLGSSKNETIYVSESLSYTLPTIKDYPREGFSRIDYKLSNVSAIDEINVYTIVDGASITANWVLSAPSITSVTGLTNDSLSRVYEKDTVTSLIANTSHDIDVANSYQWDCADAQVSTDSSYDINTVSQSGAYKLKVYATFEEYGISYTSEETIYSFDVTISRATPILAATAVDVVYDQKAHGITDAVIEYGETTAITYLYEGNTQAGNTYQNKAAPSYAGTYTASISIAETANFNALTITRSVKIEPRLVVVSLYDDMSHTYCGIGSTDVDSRYAANELKTIEAEAENEGLIAGDSLEPKLSGLSLTNSRYYAGEYTISCELLNKNYKISYTPVTYTILRRDAEIEEVSNTLTYGNDVKIDNPTLTNILDSDINEVVNALYKDNTLAEEASINSTYSYFDAGTYYIGYKDSDVLKNNYNITHTTATYTIQKRTISITPSMDSLVYNGLDQTYDVALDNAAKKHNIGDVCTISGNTNKDANSYTFSVTLNTGYEANYALSSYDNSYSISKREIELSYTFIDVPYGEEINLEYTVVDNGSEHTLLTKDKQYLALDMYIKDTTETAVKDSYGYYPANTYEIYHVANDNFDKNYTITATTTNVSIYKRTITIALEQSSMGYNGLNQTIPYTIDNEAEGQENLVLNITGQTNKNAGDYNLAAAIKDEFKNDYFLEITSYPYTITKADLSVTAGSATITYGDTYTNSVSYNGFLGNDTKEALGGEVAYSYTYAQYGTVGEYEITPSGLTSDNYNISFIPGALKVVKKDLIITPAGGTITYGDSFTNSVSYNGFVGTEDESVLTGALEYRYNGKDISKYSNASEYTISISGLAATNYEIIFETTTLNVLKKDLTITAGSGTINYGETFTNSVSYNGFAFEEADAVLGGTLVYSYTYKQYDDAGVYEITPSGLSNVNYDIAFISGTLTVNKIALNIAFEDKACTYGDSAYSYTYTGFVGTDTEADLSGTLTSTTEDASYPNVGVYEMMPEGAESNNYNITYTKGELTIVKRNATVKAVGGTISYGDSFTNSSEYLNFVEGDISKLSGTLAYSYTYTVGESVGAYEITPSGLSSDNYNITFEKATLTVEARDVIVIAEDKEITYGDELGSNTFTVTNGIDTELSLFNSLIEYSCSYTKGDNAGSYDIIPSGCDSLTNYNITYQNGTLTVKKATLTPNFVLNDIIYGDATVAYASYGGYKFEEDKALSITEVITIYDSNDNVVTGLLVPGEYHATLTASGLSNYDIESKEGSFTVDKKAVSISLDNKNIEYGTAFDLSTLYALTGLLEGDTLEVSIVILDSEIQDTSLLEKGHYTIGFLAVEDDKYEIINSTTSILTVY